MSVIAGAGEMDKREYFLYNVLGATLWGAGVTLLGYLLGSTVPNIDKYFFPIIITGLILIYIVAFWQLAKDPVRRRVFRKGIKEDYDYFFRHKGD